jgi:ribonuclease-3
MKIDKSVFETPEAIMNRLGIRFNDVMLLSRALTHKSYLNEHPEALEDNERLEFLGDAILDFLVGDWLYHRFPEMEEGRLTQMRSALVQTNQLAAFCKNLGLENAVRMGKGEYKSGGKYRKAMLCDVFESFVGALYLDQGIEIVKNFIYPMLDSTVSDILENRDIEDPKSRLQEWAQANGYPPPKYFTSNISGPDHARTFEIEVKVNSDLTGSGRGNSKQSAEKNAAREALKKIKNIL